MPAKPPRPPSRLSRFRPGRRSIPPSPPTPTVPLPRCPTPHRHPASFYLEATNINHDLTLTLKGSVRPELHPPGFHQSHHLDERLHQHRHRRRPVQLHQQFHQRSGALLSRPPSAAVMNETLWHHRRNAMGKSPPAVCSSNRAWRCLTPTPSPARSSSLASPPWPKSGKDSAPPSSCRTDV